MERRRVRGYPPGEVREYKTQFDPRVVVWIRTPTEGEKRRLGSEGELVRFDGQGNVDMGRIDLGLLVARQARFVVACVEKVEGLEDAAGVLVEDGPGLTEHGDSELVAEVALEIERAFSLDADEQKKFEASQGS